ncbi:Arm DNA-binding domain-containing protein [Lonsdalea quercina]|uniref:Arm DNA-binding domain-containing protein n=1 Tax=Lonsdalea quercina TaxID=71657 RepID=UPI0039761E48
MVLTDAVARQARSSGKGYILNDTDRLSLFVTGKGAKKWLFRFALSSKWQLTSLDTFSELTLTGAPAAR